MWFNSLSVFTNSIGLHTMSKKKSGADTTILVFPPFSRTLSCSERTVPFPSRNTSGGSTRAAAVAAGRPAVLTRRSQQWWVHPTFQSQTKHTTTHMTHRNIIYWWWSKSGWNRLHGAVYRFVFEKSTCMSPTGKGVWNKWHLRSSRLYFFDILINWLDPMYILFYLSIWWVVSKLICIWK